jgi:hypothetical protein
MYTGDYGAKRLGLHRDAVYKALSGLASRSLIVFVGWVDAGLGSAKVWTTRAEWFREDNEKKESPQQDLAEKCPCGCGEILSMRGGKPVKWARPGCKQRFWRLNQEKRESTAMFTSSLDADDVTWEEAANVDW